MNITRKRLSLIPAERNSPRILEARQLHARELLNILPERLIYLDGTGFNFHTIQHYGYSVRNTKAFLTVPTNRGQNVSLLATISTNGIIAHKVNEGPYNGGKFISFITQYLVPYFWDNSSNFLIMDILRCIIFNTAVFFLSFFKNVCNLMINNFLEYVCVKLLKIIILSNYVIIV